MPGQLIPLVLLPRYTTLVGSASGTQEFTTTPMDVTPYQEAFITVWRASLVGPSAPGPTLALKCWFEESIDQVGWTVCAGSPGGVGPTDNQQARYGVTLTKRWLRMRAKLAHQNNIVTCYAIGFVQERMR